MHLLYRFSVSQVFSERLALRCTSASFFIYSPYHIIHKSLEKQMYLCSQTGFKQINGFDLQVLQNNTAVVLPTLTYTRVIACINDNQQLGFDDTLHLQQSQLSEGSSCSQYKSFNSVQERFD